MVAIAAAAPIKRGFRSRTDAKLMEEPALADGHGEHSAGQVMRHIDRTPLTSSIHSLRRYTMCRDQEGYGRTWWECELYH